jgi:tetratricopeptide (TPR) repeat protein
VRPDSVEALSNRGLTLHVLKRFEEALASYDRALKVRPDYPEALSNRGNTLKELKRFEEALAGYDRALRVRPDFVEALSNRGLALHALRRYEEALASHDRALKVRPDYTEALLNRGNTLQELTRFGEALASYDVALTARRDELVLLEARTIEALAEMLGNMHAMLILDEDELAIANRARDAGKPSPRRSTNTFPSPSIWHEMCHGERLSKQKSPPASIESISTVPAFRDWNSF